MRDEREDVLDLLVHFWAEKDEAIRFGFRSRHMFGTQSKRFLSNGNALGRKQHD